MSNKLYKQALLILEKAAKTPPAERFQQRVNSRLIDAEGRFRCPAPIFPSYLGVTPEVKINLSDGKRIGATVARPSLPVRGVFVMVHGFAADRNEAGLFPVLAETLLGEGYVVVRYDARGLGTSTGDFARSTLPMHAQDLEEVLTWASKNTDGGTECHALGFSLGATVIALAMKQGLALRSAVFLSPAMRPSVDMWPRYNTPELRSQLETRGYLTKNQARVGSELLESLRATDLNDFAADVACDLLVCHGTTDTRIPVLTTRTVFGSKHRGITIRYIEGASHSFKPKNLHYLTLITHLREWLRK